MVLSSGIGRALRPVPGRSRAPPSPPWMLLSEAAADVIAAIERQSWREGSRDQLLTVSRRAEVDAAVERMAAELGRVDVLLN